ncbi:choice-of-anchor Q domain-containing protein [Candidatus Venteria ishoeyi]|uniref:choice-of-anchor Q domain-containing protein n=1 Tax=Candidatus Venteria ishoeyi TaxID=1899563 RepID=UPI0025A5C33C|nr:choice-of-anchor Q domain-containing protein [Candidatus Venteria ishoeyi]MDM8546929.1 choice-of-anchor Q domain-containing protein [Candidatus Venteria ishoeyi]
MSHNRYDLGFLGFYLFLLFFSQSIAANNCPIYAPLVLENPHVVGDGTPVSCTQSALQAALDQGGEISFNCGGPVTIALTEELVVTMDTVLDGAGDVTLDGQQQTRILNKQSGANLVVQNIILENAKAPGSANHFSDTCGGAILAKGAGTTLMVLNSVLRNNSVTNINTNDIAGGAIYAFGLYEAIIANSQLTGNSASNGGAVGVLASGLQVINTTFSHNQALGSRDAGPLRGHGGALNLDDVTNSQNPDSHKLLYICGSTFEHNSADNQGGASNSVFSDNLGSQMIVEDSSFIANTTTHADKGQGGAIFHMENELAGGSSEDNFIIKNSTFASNETFSQGGAVWTLIEGKITIENSTFYNNHTLNPSTGMGGGLAISRGDLHVINSTFAQNYAWFHGGGIQSSNSALVKLTNTLFYRNESERDWGNYAMNRSADEDGGGNLQFPGIRFNQNNTPDDNKITPTVLIADPLLGTLSNNGGSTQTLPLNNGSAALDVGVTAACPATDQRGLPRNHCDIGAFELQVGAGFSVMPLASGSPDKASLSLQLQFPDTTVGANGNVYLAALLGTSLFMHDATTWLPWTGGALPVYVQGVFPTSIDLPVYQNLDIRSLSGTILFVGYGRNETELLANNQFQAAYTLPQE